MPCVVAGGKRRAAQVISEQQHCGCVVPASSLSGADREQVRCSPGAIQGAACFSGDASVLNVVGFRKSGTDGLASIFKNAVADAYVVRHNLNSTSPSNGMLTNSTTSVSLKRRFEDKVVIITGGASGIGEATTRLFVANGAHVYIADIDRDRGSRLSEELGEHAQYLYCDVRKEEDVAAAVDKTIQDKGKLDVYFSNAGFVGALGSIDELSLADFDETLAVNLRGAVVSIKHAARVMKPVRRGSIICTGSVASELGGLGPHTYCISKTALKGLVRSTALELRSYGIRVNMVSPDATPTPMFMKVIKDGTGIPMTLEQAKLAMAKKSLILDRPLIDLDVANAVLFLASEEAGYISGHNLLLDAAKTVSIPFPAGYDHWFAGYAPMLK